MKLLIKTDSKVRFAVGVALLCHSRLWKVTSRLPLGELYFFVFLELSCVLFRLTSTTDALLRMTIFQSSLSWLFRESKSFFLYILKTQSFAKDLSSNAKNEILSLLWELCFGTQKYLPLSVKGHCRITVRRSTK